MLNIKSLIILFRRKSKYFFSRIMKKLSLINFNIYIISLRKLHKKDKIYKMMHLIKHFNNINMN